MRPQWSVSWPSISRTSSLGSAIFDKIRRADVFVLLDAVGYPRSGSGGMGAWCNRVRIAMQGEARWITCPLRRMRLGSPILAAEIDDSQPWRGKAAEDAGDELS